MVAMFPVSGLTICLLWTLATVSGEDPVGVEESHITDQDAQSPSNATWREDDQNLTQEEISRRIIHLTKQESFNESSETTFAFHAEDENTNHHFKRDSLPHEPAILTQSEALPQAAALKVSPQLAHSLGLRQQSTRGLFNHKFIQNALCSKCSRHRNLCQIVSGIFTRSPLPYGYSLVTHIPAGICNITIVEIKPSKNFFAIRRRDNTYALNGNWKIQAAGSYVIGGTLFKYAPADGVIGEKLESPGPLREPIDLMLIYQSKNPGIRYEYRIPFAATTNPVQQPPRTPLGTPQSYPPSKFFGPENNIPGASVAGNSFPPARQGTFVNNARYPYQGLSPQSSGLPVYHQRSTGGYGGPSNAPHSKNWGPFYPHSSGRTPGQMSPRLPKNQEEEAEANFQRFPEIIQADPEIITSKPEKVYNFAEVPSVHNVANYTGVHTGLGKHHRTRHQHGQRVYPGPAVDGSKTHLQNIDDFQRRIQKPPTKISGENSVATDEQARHNHKKKRKKKKGRRRKDRYQWVFKGLTKCSRLCGGGNQTSVLSCEKKRKNKVVSDKRCIGIEKPQIKVVSCNLKPCPAAWMPGTWGDCSVTCGNGTQTREVSCKQEVSPTLTLAVQEGACQTPSQHKLSRPCNAGPCPTNDPYWRTEPWSNCSSACGNGTRSRKVQCVVWLSVEDDSVCDKAKLPKPHAIESCSSNSCSLNSWHFSEWSNECLGHCGRKKETRIVFCMADEHKLCPLSAKPPTTRPCADQSACSGLWFAGEWSECSVSCGVGHESRPVECLAMKDNRWRPAPMKDCEKRTKPSQTRECVKEKCSPKWYITEWSECSAACGVGLRTRAAKCLTIEADVSSTCPLKSRPHVAEECNITPCSHMKGSSSEELDLPQRPPVGDDQDAYEEDSSDDLEEDPLYEDREDFDNTIDDPNDDEEDPDPMKEEEQIEDNHLNLIPRKDDPDKYTEEPNEDSEDSGQKKKEERDKKKTSTKINCMDRIKNCHLVFRARLCRLKYYNKLCCATCKQ